VIAGLFRNRFTADFSSVNYPVIHLSVLVYRQVRIESIEGSWSDVHASQTSLNTSDIHTALRITPVLFNNREQPSSRDGV
jgi:hypothetical protein